MMKKIKELICFFMGHRKRGFIVAEIHLNTVTGGVKTVPNGKYVYCDRCGRTLEKPKEKVLGVNRFGEIDFIDVGKVNR